MAASRGPSKAVQLRHEKLDAVVRIVADGLFEAGRVIVERSAAIAPDSPFDPYPTGEGLPKQGGVNVYVEGQKVNGWSIRGPQPVKPRAARIIVREHVVTVVAGFGFPARLAERGTVDTPAQPFLEPTMRELAPRIPNIVGEVTRPKLRGNT